MMEDEDETKCEDLNPIAYAFEPICRVTWAIVRREEAALKPRFWPSLLPDRKLVYGNIGNIQDFLIFHPAISSTPVGRNFSVGTPHPRKDKTHTQYTDTGSGASKYLLP